MPKPKVTKAGFGGVAGRGGGERGERRLCWGRTKGEDKDYFKPVLITAPNGDWGWEPQLSEGGWGKRGQQGGAGLSPPTGTQPSPTGSLGPRHTPVAHSRGLSK